MKTTRFAATLLTSISTLLAVSAMGATQSPRSMEIETAKLAKVLQGRTLKCTNKKGQETLSLSVTSKGSKQSIRTASTYGDGGDESSILQLSVGELVMAYVTGPDVDEGGAVVMVSSYDIEEYGKANANAQIFSGVAGDDEGSNQSEALKCSAK